MQLLRLEVRNWCQHKHRVCTFTRGLVAIIGKIGSGKSNLLGAICWLLTGENPNAGVKADNVSQLSPDGEPAHAILEFEHAGHLVVVTRHLLPEKEPSTLLVDGVELARGDKAVTAQIEKLLGIDSKFLSRFVIVAQNEIFAFIEDGATEVDKFFQKLFGTANAEKCNDLIGKQLNKLVIPEIVETSAQLSAGLPDIDEQITGLTTEIAALPTVDMVLATQLAQQKITSDWHKRQELGKGLALVSTQLTENTSYQAQLSKACEQYATDIAALKSAIAGTEGAHTDARVALNHLATYRQIAKVKASNKARLQEIVDIRAQLVEPPAAAESDLLAAAKKQQEAELALKAANDFVAVFATAGVANCPTCHTPASNLTEELEQTKASLPALEAAIASATASVASVAQQLAVRAAWEQQIAKLTAEERQLLDASKSFADISAPAASEDELRELISNHENLQKAQAELEPIAQKAREKLAGLTGAINTLTENKQKLLADIAQITVTASDADLAEHTLATLRDKCAQRQKKDSERTQLQYARETLCRKISDAQTNEHRAVNLREWADIAAVTKDALKAAPRIVATRNLQRLEVAINELLQIFGVDFFIKAAADDSPTFVAEFFDGRKQPAKRLSYGQKTVLALAFRVAVNAMFAEEIGLLALDEPTAYLDQQRIKALAPVLEKLRELSTARGLQCLLVTHETSLSHLFESAVELDA
jgi:DNA repair exonuclease SbcCD ATPase subunit